MPQTRQSRHQSPPDPAIEGENNPGTENESETAGDTLTGNPWRPMDEAPIDHIIEGRFSPDEEVGRPIRWRASRRREQHRWVNGGVWHAAETAGAVQLRPVEWREWERAEIRFDPKEEPVTA
jgi:hypothetical protein